MELNRKKRQNLTTRPMTHSSSTGTTYSSPSNQQTVWRVIFATTGFPRSAKNVSLFFARAISLHEKETLCSPINKLLIIVEKHDRPAFTVPPSQGCTLFWKANRLRNDAQTFLTTWVDAFGQK